MGSLTWFLSISGSVCRGVVRLRERSCAQRSLSSVKHGGSPCSDFLSCLKSSMAFACAQGGIRCSCQLSGSNSKVSADVPARLLSSAEPIHTQVDHRPFNSSTDDSRLSRISVAHLAHLFVPARYYIGITSVFRDGALFYLSLGTSTNPGSIRELEPNMWYFSNRISLRRVSKGA
jgi:hypothetical protein